MCGILLFSNCNRFKKDNLEIQVNITEKLSSNKFKQYNGTFYSVRIDLINNTDSVIYFWTLSCSWEDNWLSSTKALYLLGRVCDSNSPILRQIEPGKKFTFNGTIRVKEKLDRTDELKLGFILISKNEMSDGDDLDKILTLKYNKQKDIIWSTPFKIDK